MSALENTRGADESFDADEIVGVGNDVASDVAVHASTLDDPIVFGHRLCLIIWEVWADRRPIEQVGPWVSERVHQELVARITLVRQARRLSVQAGVGVGGDIRLGAHRLSRLSSHDTEFCAIATVDGFTRAIAIGIRAYPFGLRAIALHVI